MIQSVGSTSSLAYSQQHPVEQTGASHKPKHAEKQDSVQLSQKAQQAIDADHDGDSH